MKDTNIEIRVSLEELALALSLSGKPGLAKGLLSAMYGEIPSAEEQGRLIAAGHSLIAHGLLSIQDGEPRLENTLGSFLEDLANSEYIITFDRRQGDEIHHLSYYFRGPVIVEERLLQGVVCTIASIPDRQTIITRGLEFFEIGQDNARDYAPIVVPAPVLDKAKEAAERSTEAVQAVLNEAGVPHHLRLAIAKDFYRPVYRGSCLRIETRNDQFTSDRGFLLLRGRERTWLMHLRPEGTVVSAEIIPGTLSTFSQEVQLLME